jgi:hypothetical protein
MVIQKKKRKRAWSERGIIWQGGDRMKLEPCCQSKMYIWWDKRYSRFQSISITDYFSALLLWNSFKLFSWFLITRFPFIRDYLIRIWMDGDLHEEGSLLAKFELKMISAENLMITLYWMGSSGGYHLFWGGLGIRLAEGQDLKFQRKIS